MARYLLDTSILIDLSKGREPARSRVHRMIANGDEVAACAISVAEFIAGLAPEERRRWDTFMDRLPYWDITREMAKQAGIDRYAFRREGQTLSTTDCLLAAIARAQGATLVTNNVKDFPMADIELLRCFPIAEWSRRIFCMTTKTTRIHVHLPTELIEEIDRRAGRRHRSEFIAEVLTMELNRRRRFELGRHLMGSLADVDIPGWESSEAASEWVRKLRQESDRFDTDGNPIER